MSSMEYEPLLTCRDVTVMPDDELDKVLAMAEQVLLKDRDLPYTNGKSFIISYTYQRGRTSTALSALGVYATLIYVIYILIIQSSPPSPSLHHSPCLRLPLSHGRTSTPPPPLRSFPPASPFPHPLPPPHPPPPPPPLPSHSPPPSPPTYPTRYTLPHPLPIPPISTSTSASCSPHTKPQTPPAPSPTPTPSVCAPRRTWRA